MTKEQLFGIVRTLAAFGFGYLASSGLIDGAAVERAQAVIDRVRESLHRQLAGEA